MDDTPLTAAASPARSAVVDSPSQATDNNPFRPLIVWIGIPLAINNFALAPLIASMFTPYGLPSVAQFFIPFCMCLIVVQAVLASLCFVLGSQRWVVRVSIYLLVVLMGWLCWFGGYLTTMQRDTDTFSQLTINGQLVSTEVADVLRYLRIFPVLAIGFQVPFWITRFLHGWRLLPPNIARGYEPENASNPFSIRDLLLATSLVAVSLSLLLAVPESPESSDARSLVFSTLTYSSIAAFHTYLVAVPLVAIFFRVVDLRFAWLFAVGMILLGGISLVAFLLLTTPRGTPLGQIWQPMATIVGLHACYVTTIGLALCILRWHGWTLARRAIASSDSLTIAQN
ncbi:hypothetical protein NA78x_003172 [Anatilimnocola sp. NA78]|uniref:hypothetical protein n=1 Tax=Anatilimnocola sp. NA78 TaxID=3415683 RepID=UPI003CE5C078